MWSSLNYVIIVEGIFGWLRFLKLITKYDTAYFVINYMPVCIQSDRDVYRYSHRMLTHSYDSMWLHSHQYLANKMQKYN